MFQSPFENLLFYYINTYQKYKLDFLLPNDTLHINSKHKFLMSTKLQY